MPIPDFQSILLPLLQSCADGQEHGLRETIETLATTFQLTEEERQELLPSGSQAIFDNRVGWSKTHLMKAGLLESPRRAYFKLTEAGREVLKTNPKELNVAYLKRYPAYLEFIGPNVGKSGKQEEKEVVLESATPEEVLESAYGKIRKALASDLLEKIKQCPPAFFERLVVELLVKMGYGGSIKDAGRATKLTGDGGIDGIIKEDMLGLDFIYLQAKRWDSQPIGRPDVQSFVGALDGQRANKGVFITTSSFTAGALEYVKSISKRVILIDGYQLANYMIDYGLGVSTSATYDLKRIDNDYFEVG
ncbi:MAG: restriction endonuclease [Saprospiraceae bacterium]|jgi:restriction system protein|nr:restriction endonuclease [Saprospiraceae bacterium]